MEGPVGSQRSFGAEESEELTLKAPVEFPGIYDHEDHKNLLDVGRHGVRSVLSTPLTSPQAPSMPREERRRPIPSLAVLIGSCAEADRYAPPRTYQQRPALTRCFERLGVELLTFAPRTTVPPC